SVRVVANVDVIAKARGGAQIARVAVEGAAAQDALPALAAGPGRAVGGRAAIVVVPAILHPLGRVAGSVEQPERVCRKAAGRNRLLAGPAAAVTAIGQTDAEGSAPPERGLGSAAGGIFPFGFARQPILLSGLLRQPLEEGERIAPAEVGCRPLAA